MWPLTSREGNELELLENEASQENVWICTAHQI
jgi:hypothetical protein